MRIWGGVRNMAKVSPYLRFEGNTQEAFNFYNQFLEADSLLCRASRTHHPGTSSRKRIAEIVVLDFTSELKAIYHLRSMQKNGKTC